MDSRNNVYLASASPRRLELLQNLGCCIAQFAVPFDEPKVSNFKAPLSFMELCIEGKYQQASQYFIAQKEIHNEIKKQAKIAIVADTIVAIGTNVLGKPVDKIDAFAMLKKLSGAEHQVFTGYKLWITCAQLCDPVFFRTKIVVTKVRFKNLPDKFLKNYIRSGEPMDKAGAYGVQGEGLRLIESIDGSYSSVMGLPLCELMDDLRDARSYLSKGAQ